MTRICPSCKTENPDSAEFCQTCGNSLTGSGNVKPNQTKDKKGKFTARNIGIASACCVGVIIILVVFGMLSSDNTTNSTKMSSSDVKVQATSVDVDDFQHNAASMAGKPIKVTGKVFGIQNNMFLLFTKETSGYWTDDVVYVNVDGTIPSTLTNDDIVTIYAVCDGKIEYSTAIGGSNKVPEVTVKPENIITTS